MKILMFDIETTSVYSSSGIIVAIGIFDPEKMREPIVQVINNPEDETKLLEWFKEEVERENYTICGWNSKNFDLPFILGRALQLGLDFSALKEVEHIDLIEIARENFRFRSNRMEEVCKLLKVEYDPEISGEVISINFMKSLAGDKESKEKIIQRCKKDLIALHKLYEKFKPYLNLK